MIAGPAAMRGRHKTGIEPGGGRRRHRCQVADKLALCLAERGPDRVLRLLTPRRDYLD